ncbi:MAG: DUF2828 family protein [Candidatus Adiutrix sp.]|jgi:hypothetical protein|nr:DUF2828 family protein [Candidatus Adiutrix sp.]
MLESLKKEANKTFTENLAATHATTCSDCLDLFATIGALRQAPEGEIESRFLRAYAENPDLALKIAFFARDVREGLGERRAFRLILAWLAENEPGAAKKNIRNLPEYGRFDDLLALLGTKCEKTALDYAAEQIEADLASMAGGGPVSLLAKWLPSVNASNKETVRRAKIVARALGLNEAEYRKKLSRLREYLRILENSLRRRDYSFDYEKQPSKALFKYRKAFLRRDGERYRAFLERVAAGEATLKVGALTPYDIIAPFFSPTQVSEEDRQAIDATWKAQEDFTNGENALAVIDGSGSMYFGAKPLPASVALSLGLYFAERNTGAFHGHFITFSHRPQLVEIKGADIFEKVCYCHDFNEVANTNIQKVFELVLDAAAKNRVEPGELPKTLYFISDMEFDACTEDATKTNFEYARELFARNGYALPRVVFWNVSSRNRQQPVRQNEEGVMLVSGCTPRLFSMLTSGALTPYAYMMEVLSSERYAKIAA